MLSKPIQYGAVELIVNDSIPMHTMTGTVHAFPCTQIIFDITNHGSPIIQKTMKIVSRQQQKAWIALMAEFFRLKSLGANAEQKAKSFAEADQVSHP